MTLTEEELQNIIKLAYDRGFDHGLCTYAHWKDGKEMVGTCGHTLSQARETRRDAHTYRPVQLIHLLPKA